MCKEKVENEEGWKDDDDTREKSKDRYRRRAPEPEGLFRHIDGPCVHAGLPVDAREQISIDVVVMFLASSDFNRQFIKQRTETQVHRVEKVPIEKN